LSGFERGDVVHQPLHAVRIAERPRQLVTQVERDQGVVQLGVLALEGGQPLQHVSAVEARVGLQPGRHLVRAALECRHPMCQCLQRLGRPGDQQVRLLIDRQRAGQGLQARRVGRQYCLGVGARRQHDKPRLQQRPGRGQVAGIEMAGRQLDQHALPEQQLGAFGLAALQRTDQRLGLQRPGADRRQAALQRRRRRFGKGRGRAVGRRGPVSEVAR